MYPPRKFYSVRQLIRFRLLDHLADIRCAVRDGLPDYAEKVRIEFRLLWRKRHRAII